MYRIYLNTKSFERRNNYRKWTDQLINDQLIMLDEFEKVSNSKDEILYEFKKLIGREAHRDGKYLESEFYGEQFVEYRLPGLCTGYVDIEKAVARAEQHGREEIKFSDFYDIRALGGIWGKQLRKCFVIIEYKK